MMDPTLQVLPRDGLPERRALILTSTEESYGFAIGEGVDARVSTLGRCGSLQPCEARPGNAHRNVSHRAGFSQTPL